MHGPISGTSKAPQRLTFSPKIQFAGPHARAAAASWCRNAQLPRRAQDVARLVMAGSRPPIGGAVPLRAWAVLEACWAPEPRQRASAATAACVLSELLTAAEGSPQAVSSGGAAASGSAAAPGTPAAAAAAAADGADAAPEAAAALAPAPAPAASPAAAVALLSASAAEAAWQEGEAAAVPPAAAVGQGGQAQGQQPAAAAKLRPRGPKVALCVGVAQYEGEAPLDNTARSHPPPLPPAARALLGPSAAPLNRPRAAA
jgi:hypothetical protein